LSTFSLPFDPNDLAVDGDPSAFSLSALAAFDLGDDFGGYGSPKKLSPEQFQQVMLLV